MSSDDTNVASPYQMAHFMRAIIDDLFVLLPLVVVILVLLFKGHNISELVISPEWAFAAAVVFGQTIVRLVSGTISAPSTIYPGLLPHLVAFWITSLIVFGVVPSCVVLAVLLVSDQPTIALGITQLVLFALSLAASFLLGASNMIGEKQQLG